jgi:hypothetical protein
MGTKLLCDPIRRGGYSTWRLWATQASQPVPISTGPRALRTGQRTPLHSASIGTSAIPQAVSRPRSMQARWPQVKRPLTTHFG